MNARFSPRVESCIKRIPYLGLLIDATVHPLDKRFVRKFFQQISWTAYNRLSKSDVVISSANGSQLVVPAFMKGVYPLLCNAVHEFTWMSFAFHYLRKEDLFLDVGANIGSYAIPVTAVSGCQVIAMEPDPGVFNYLVMNSRVNNFEGRIQALNRGCGSRSGTLRFTSGLGVINYVLPADDTTTPSQTVVISTLDEIARDRNPTYLKIDVEGFESEVIHGAEALFKKGSVQVISIELTGTGARYGYDEEALHKKIATAGYQPCEYEPFQRKLIALPGIDPRGTTIYVKDMAQANERCRTAPGYKMSGQTV
jgi:FkbM family methyltransferase